MSTNRDINEAISTGKLREDLYHRLAGTVLHLPPLRDRKEDLTLLLNYYKDKYDSLFNISSKEFDNYTIDEINKSNWNGNIRQLSNFVKNWCLFSENASRVDVIKWINSENTNHIDSEISYSFREGTMSELEDAKTWLINRALSKFDGNKSKAAEHLGLSYAGFLKMLKKQSEE